MTELTMPRLSDSMEEGTILKWLIADGDPVAAGDDLVEIETDKATMTHTADSDGVLQILAGEGDTLAVGEPIARLASADERDGGESAHANGHTAAPVDEVADSRAPAAATAGIAAASPTTVSGATSDEVAATPLARRVAQQHHVDLAALIGSGPRGRIVKADVLAAAGLEAEPPRRATVAANGAAAAPAPAPAVADGAAKPADGAARPADGAKDSRIEPLTRLQQVVARRMAEAKATVPEFGVQTEVDMGAAIELRARLKQTAGDQPAPSLNDLIVKAAALALRDHPRANASYRDDGFELHDRINVGVAVAADDALVVPVVDDADRKSLGEIARTTRRLAERVRSGEITPPELSGGTFTVSNLGMFGMTAISPVIDIPQAAILGVGAARTTLARDDDGDIVDRHLLTLTLTCDHRILYGADAARLLADIKTLLETPLSAAL